MNRHSNSSSYSSYLTRSNGNTHILDTPMRGRLQRLGREEEEGEMYRKLIEQKNENFYNTNSKRLFLNLVFP